jgi:hypothetical protein
MSASEKLPVDRVPIEPNRRLIDEVVEARSGIEEFYDVILDQRVLHIPAGKQDVELHARLIEARLPVLSAIFDEEGNCDIQVPLGANRMSQLLKFIPRDIRGYGLIFEQLGAINRHLEDTGFGALQARIGRGILDSVAFTSVENSSYGGAVFLIPPYDFNPTGIAEGVTAEVGAELSESGYFAHEQITTLLSRVRIGVGNAG